MADSVRRQIAADLASSFAALTTANSSKIHVALVQRYLIQPEEHPTGIDGWRVGFYLGKETRLRTDPGMIVWQLEGEAQASTARVLSEYWDPEDADTGVIEEWRQEAAADAMDELKHALEGSGAAVNRGGLAITTEILDRYADEGFPAKDATSRGGREVFCGCLCRFRITYLDQPSRT